jgi:N-acetyl-gamma-glutamyl-phosphate reductase common form
MFSVAIIGARGYVGSELIRLLDQHPLASLELVSSRSYEGQYVQSLTPDFSNKELCYKNISLDLIPQKTYDVIFLALPNGIAIQHQEHLEELSKHSLLIDLSADFRFHNDWVYGQPETQQTKILKSKKISNPGCYATAIQLGLHPILHHLDGAPTAFAVSGYSGAGTKPSQFNDLNHLKNNLLAYKPTGHIHEREVKHVLNHPLHFHPHVANHFRGIHVTISGQLKDKLSADDLSTMFKTFYANEPLVGVQESIPEIKSIQNTPHALIGGFTLSEQSEKHFVLYSCLDNLLKGAASQAIQNMNLALSQSFNTTQFMGVDL